MKNNQMKHRLKIISPILLALLIIGVATVLSTGTSTISPGTITTDTVTTTTINATLWYNGVTNNTDLMNYPQGSYSYLIFTVGSTIYAKNGTTGTIDYSSTNASYVFNSVTNTISGAYNSSTGGLTIFIKQGVYTFTTLWHITQAHIKVVGEPNTIIQGNIMPILKVEGPGIDVAGVVNDIQFSNIHFVYTGSDTSGYFIYLKYLQNDKNYYGPMAFENIIITGNFTSTPNSPEALLLESIIGMTFDRLSISYMGTGVDFYSSGGFQGSHLTFNYLTVSYAQYGVTEGNAGYTEIVYNSLKIMHTSTEGMYLQTADITLNNPQFESCGGWAAIQSKANKLIVTNGRFSSVGTRGINLDACASGYSDNLICFTSFGTVTTAILVTSNTVALTLQENEYASTTTNVSVVAGTKVFGNDLGFRTSNSGSLTNTTATTFIIAHGLASNATGFWASFNDSGITGYSWVNTNATHITVTIQGTPSGATPNCYWMAEYKP